MTDTVLCINAGSSSLKFKLFEALADGGLSVSIEGQLDGIGVKPHLKAADGAARPLADRQLSPAQAPDTGAAVPMLLQWLRDQLNGVVPVVIGHRVVFGGTRYAAPVRIDDAVLAELRALVPMMPLHLPPELAPIEAIRAHLPDLPQVAVFDTGFHRGHDEVVERLPLPDTYYREGLRRYGYHGISYEYIAQRLPAAAPDIADGRVVVAHLGSGCSMAALVGGRSVETTMSFTALDGLTMGTRPGRLDPGVVLYLFQVKGMSAKAVEDLLYKESGLKGLSGISNDVRALLNRRRCPREDSVGLFQPELRPRGRGAGDRDGRDRRAGVHGRGRRARCAGTRCHRGQARVAGSRDRRGRECPAWPADLRRAEPDCLLCHPHQ